MYEEYFNKLKEECIIRNRTDGTFANYRQCILKFLAWINKTPEDLTLEDARSYIFDLRINQKKASRYCNLINSSLRFFYRFVLNKQWDPDVVPRMANDILLPQVTTLENIEKLIDTATNVRNKAIIALLYSSGLRVSELCNLAPSDIYMSTMQVHIRNSKNHCDHWTILSERALDLLIEYWKSYPVKRDFLFVSLDEPHDPLKMNGVELMIRKIGKEACVEKAHPHLLRHCFASHMIEQGVPLEYIQAMMGHRHADSTHRYIHVANKSLMGIKSPLDHPAGEKERQDEKDE